MPVPYYQKMGKNALGPTLYFTHLTIFPHFGHPKSLNIEK